VGLAECPRSVQSGPGYVSARTDIEIPTGIDLFELKIGQKKVTLTNLQKLFWPQLGKTKRDLLFYYASMSDLLLPHLKNRALVISQYPNGVIGNCVLMKHLPNYRPAWLATCTVEHRTGKLIDYLMAQDLASLLWIVNLGCIEMNPWHATCDDTGRPDILLLNLDPIPSASFGEVAESALLVKAYLDQFGISSFAKLTGSRGVHVYVPIYRKYKQKAVWRVAKRIATDLARLHPNRITAEHHIARRPAGRVLVDYNQNAWGRTLASVYSLIANPYATVSAPVTWDEIAAGVSPRSLNIDSIGQRAFEQGDLFRAMIQSRDRCNLEVLADTDQEEA
jgi:bifunctional non-homologous end joining protein LigD